MASWTLGNLSPDQIQALQMHFSELRDRVDVRRNLFTNGIPKDWSVHWFKQYSSNSAVLICVDDCTTGRWGYNIKDNVIAFEDSKDLTMFLLSYTAPEPIYRS